MRRVQRAGLRSFESSRAELLSAFSRSSGCLSHYVVNERFLDASSEGYRLGAYGGKLASKGDTPGGVVNREESSKGVGSATAESAQLDFILGFLPRASLQENGASVRVSEAREE